MDEPNLDDKAALSQVSLLMIRLLIATGNHHKADEIRTMLGNEFQVEDLRDHPSLESPEETGITFEDNAIIKALAASEKLPGVIVVADDSGLEVDALDGAPGVISARYAGLEATDVQNREKLKGALRDLVAKGSAEPFAGRFRCSMVIAKNNEVLASFDGTIEGHILLSEEGEGGFGYDPLFIPEGFEHSFGVLPATTKNQLSHRFRALTQVVGWVKAHAAAS